MMIDVNAKTVVITGASRGIGKAAAYAFAAAGANVVLLARGADAIRHIAADIGAKALAIPCDIADWNAVQRAIGRAASHFGTIDVLINNAGTIEPIELLAASDPGGWGQVIDVNLKGVYYGVRAVLPIMHENGGGTILNISSGAAHHALEGWSAYCASKAAVHMLTKSIHAEQASRNIRVMGLSPGTVATEMQREIKASGINPVSELDWSDHIPPTWPAQALLWMCGPDADIYIGQEIALRDQDIRAKIGLAE